MFRSIVVTDKRDTVLVDLGVALKNSTIATHGEASANYVEFAEGGFCRVDFGSDVNGNSANWFVEFVHETENGAKTTFRYLNLAERGIDSDTLIFNQLDKLRIKASVDEDGRNSSIKFKLVIEKLA